MTRENTIVLTLCAACLAVSSSNTASASELRFSETAAGNVVATGNALGLSKQVDANGPGTEDSIGTFMSLDGNSVDDFPANAANPWFEGTTNDWTLDGSEADLVLPARSEILYAELVWGGSSNYSTENVTAFVDDPVTIAFGGDSMEVSPDPVTALTIEEISQQGFAANYYMRSADVTEFVMMHGAGTYAVSGVPATQDTLVNSLNAAGWTLVVAYRNSGEPIRNLTVFVGGSFVDEDATEEYDFAGFCTPPQGDFEGRAVVSAIEGDADLVGDSLAIAETINDAFVTLEGPNNPVNNFFGSQINGPDGMLDQTGTFGMRNHDAVAGTTVVGGRQSWDVTAVAVSSTQGHLSAGQTSAVLRTQTTGDSFVPTTVAFGIQVNAPDFSGDGTGAGANPTALALDDTSTVTISMENVGLVDASNIVFTAPLPEGLDLDTFAVDGNPGDINGAAVDAAALETGVDLGTVEVGTTRQIEMVVRSVGAPAQGATQYVIEPMWSYDYVSCVGDPPLTEPHSTAPVTIDFTEMGTTGGPETTSDSASATDGETSDSASATAGDTMASASATDTAGTDSASDSDSSGAVDDDDGCGCTTRGRRASWAVALLGLLGLRRRRAVGGARAQIR